MNNEKTNSKILVCLYIIIGLLLVNTIVLIISNADNSSSDYNDQTDESTEYDVSMFNEITADTMEDAVASGTHVVYIGRETCGYCVAFLPAIQQAEQDYGYTTMYLDISKITTEEQQKQILAFDNDDKFLETNFGSTPMVLIMKDGKLVNGWVGYDEYDAFTKFLEENGITKAE